MITLIPDIHGHADKLAAMLRRLGWQADGGGGFRTPAPGDRLCFLGDFIDRGPENGRVLRLVRALTDSGKASAVMGNHELNAVLLHSVSAATGAPLRPRSAKNLAQHAQLLAEFPLGSPGAGDWVGWMRGLALLHEGPGYRAVHACWDSAAIARCRAALPGARLSEDLLHAPGFAEGALFAAIEVLTKGREARLPDGAGFRDPSGHWRDMARIAWWRRTGESWRDLGMPGADVVLPATPIPAGDRGEIYADAVPVFFGHYWLTGTPRLEAPTALCLDYSAGAGGPLVGYRFDPAAPALSPAQFVIV